MFKSLRSRLLLSYFALITLLLLVIATALLVVAARPGVRYSPTLQRLNAIGQNHRYELVRLREAGADAATLRASFDRAAVDNQVRIVVTNAATQRVVYDSDEEDSWVGITVSGVDRRLSRLFPNLDQEAIFGRFQPPDGSNWLVFSPPSIPASNTSLQVFYILPEPTALNFFRQFFFRPLVVAGAITLLLALALAAIIAGSVAGPLQRLAAAAGAVAAGDYDQQAPVRGPQEVRTVADSFNSMAAQVKTSQQAQRDFVANVSHDLKTPITSISGWSQALIDGTADSPAAQQQAAQVIHQEAARMSRLVNQLLDLVRIESGQLQLAREPVDLAQVLAEVRRNLALRVREKGITLTLDAEIVPPVPGDHDRLMQVFTNLVDNALTHTPEGGQVSLSLRPYNEGAVEAVVADTGPGIAAAELSRIFERFYRVDKSRTQDNRRRGSGLGLAIAQELVAAHNGRILAHSEAGEGSVFIVRLPTGVAPAGSTITRRGDAR